MFPPVPPEKEPADMAPVLTMAERMRRVRALLDLAAMPGTDSAMVTLPAEDVRAGLEEIETLQAIHKCAQDGETSSEAALEAVLARLDETVAPFPRRALTDVLERYGAMRMEMEQMQRAVMRAASAPGRLHMSDTVRVRLTEEGMAHVRQHRPPAGSRIIVHEDGVMTGQLWQVMANLGAGLRLGSRLIEGDVEVIPPPALSNPAPG